MIGAISHTPFFFLAIEADCGLIFQVNQKTPSWAPLQYFNIRSVVSPGGLSIFITSGVA